MKLEKNEMVRRFKELSAREKMLLIGGLVVVVTYCAYQWFYQPLAAESVLLQQKIRSQSQVYRHLQQVGAEVSVLRQQGISAAPESENQSPMAVADSSSQQLGIKPFIKRLQPEGSDKVTIWLEAVSFDQFVYWLAILQDKHRLAVIQADIDKQAAGEGLVNAKILLGG